MNIGRPARGRVGISRRSRARVPRADRRLLVPDPSPNHTAAYVGDCYQTHTDGIRLGPVLLAAGVTLLAPIAAVIAGQPRRIAGDTSPAGYLELGMGPRQHPRRQQHLVLLVDRRFQTRTRPRRTAVKQRAPSNPASLERLPIPGCAKSA